MGIICLSTTMDVKVAGGRLESCARKTNEHTQVRGLNRLRVLHSSTKLKASLSNFHQTYVFIVVGCIFRISKEHVEHIPRNTWNKVAA